MTTRDKVLGGAGLLKTPDLKFFLNDNLFNYMLDYMFKNKAKLSFSDTLTPIFKY